MVTSSVAETIECARPRRPDGPCAICVTDLSYRYNDARSLALRDVSFTVERGDFVALMGPSGAGKTTLCLALNGIIPSFFGGKFYGSVEVLGRDTLSLTVADLAQDVGMVLEDPEMQLVTNSVEDEVAFGLENVRVPCEEIRSRITEALDIVRLTGYEAKHPHTLSGGQKQRLAIAAALALRPKIMVLDEPTSQLDPIGVDEVFSVINDLNERLEVTVILVTHNSERVAEYADRVLLMDEGRVFADCAPEQFFQDLCVEPELAVRLPQVTEFYAHFDRQIHPVPKLPTRMRPAVEQMESLWPSIAFEPRDYSTEEMEVELEDSPIISVEDLCFIYPDGTEALENVSLDIHRGECLAIIGQNGGGKSTLVKHFVKLLEATRGRVAVFGEDVTTYSTSALARRIGLIYQNPDAQIFCKSVEEEVAFGPVNQLRDQEEVKRRVEDAIEMMGLQEVRDEHPLALSKGHRERVAVASVLAMEPEVLIFDEPTTGQDYIGAHKIMQMIRELNEQGRTIIVITHHLHLLPGYVKRVILLGDGEVLLDAPLRQAFGNTDLLHETYLEPPQIVRFVKELERLSGHELNAQTPGEALALFPDGAGRAT